MTAAKPRPSPSSSAGGEAAAASWGKTVASSGRTVAAVSTVASSPSPVGSPSSQTRPEAAAASVSPTASGVTGVRPEAKTTLSNSRSGVRRSAKTARGKPSSWVIRSVTDRNRIVARRSRSETSASNRRFPYRSALVGPLGHHAGPGGVDALVRGDVELVADQIDLRDAFAEPDVELVLADQLREGHRRRRLQDPDPAETAALGGDGHRQPTRVPAHHHQVIGGVATRTRRHPLP